MARISGTAVEARVTMSGSSAEEGRAPVMGSLTLGMGWPTGVVNARWRWCALSTKKNTSLAHVTFKFPSNAGLVMLGIASRRVGTLGRVAVRLVEVVE
jgi:hypothetical protein